MLSRRFQMRTDKIRGVLFGAFLAVAAPATVLSGGCSWEFVNNNACQIFNCDTLFFLDDILEGAANFSGGTGGGMDDTDADDEHDEAEDGHED